MRAAVLSLAVVLVVVAVDWAALHDVLRGEADVTNEYFVMAVSGVIYGGVIGYWFRKWRNRRPPPDGEA
jgi:hypothetical protein